MAYTFLQAVNRVLKRTGLIAGDSGDLTTFTDSARQREVDITIQVWNEAIHRLYAKASFEGETASGTITLVTDQREYTTPSDFERFPQEEYKARVMTNTDGHRLYEYPGGYARMFADQIDPSDFQGQPSYWALNTSNSKFRLDTTPTSDENGDVYSFVYEKRIALTATTDTFPFNDTIVDALMPIVAGVTVLARNGDVSEEAWAGQNFRDAIKLMGSNRSSKNYGRRTVECRQSLNPFSN